MRRVWLIGLALGLAVLLRATPLAAQGRAVLFDGTVVDEAGQPGGERVVVVFFNSREVGRGATACDAGGCQFEVVVADETGIGAPGPDGAPHASVGIIEVGKPVSMQAPGTTPGRRGVYVVLALKEAPAELAPALQTGRLGLLPDSSLAVIEPTRPPAPPRPAAQTTGIGVSGFPWLAVSLLALACCGTLLALAALMGLMVFALRRPTTTG